MEAAQGEHPEGAAQAEHVPGNQTWERKSLASEPPVIFASEDNSPDSQIWNL